MEYKRTIKNLIARIKKRLAKGKPRKSDFLDYMFMNPFHIDVDGDIGTKKLDADKITAGEITYKNTKLKQKTYEFTEQSNDNRKAGCRTGSPQHTIRYRSSNLVRSNKRKIQKQIRGAYRKNAMAPYCGLGETGRNLPEVPEKRVACLL